MTNAEKKRAKETQARLTTLRSQTQDLLAEINLLLWDLDTDANEPVD